MAVLKWFGVCLLVMACWAVLLAVLVNPILIIPVGIAFFWNADRIGRFLDRVHPT